MEQKILAIFVLALVAIFELTSAVSPNNTMSCFVCNSITDPACDDKFEKSSTNVARFNTSCTWPHNAGCRKMKQFLVDTWHVVRQCSGVEDERFSKTCVERVGTKGARIYYCNCMEAGCNSALALLSLTPSGVLTLALAALLASFSLLVLH